MRGASRDRRSGAESAIRGARSKRWVNPAERDAFFEYAAANGLSRYAGQVLPRNGESSPWTQTIDMTITQQLPIFKRVHAEVYFQIINFANLFDDSWGLLEEVPFSFKRTVAGAIYDPAGNGGQGQYGHLFNGNMLDGISTVADDTQASRWQAKLGVRIRF